MHEKRAHPRAPVNIDVEFQIDDGGSGSGVAKDISVGGMFVEAESAPPFRSKLTIRCRLPTSDDEMSLPGVVRWAKPGGFGVQFGLLGARETHAITELTSD